MTYELFPFKMFRQAFYCHQGSKYLGNCRFFNCFFVDDSDFALKNV